ncbi:chloroperoxidase-like protein [Colletotrichum truncatum]|uniref:Chloroperoxidase-like protein n=1 Tax=Colletotrichum truncatum TaxID=5467 RepID=A0ACC3ZH27_COLTU|nr:chloroperoxidase-like protein [Colletotrichum truncatum]KAF6784731.1 chloroperoxidase-like protein [Colletotrichum truncatum]
MKKQLISFLICVTSGVTSALYLAEDPKFPYRKPDKTANRSPCPVLNALANHGYLPREGTGITMDQLKGAFTMAFNLDESVTVAVSKLGFTTSTTGNPNTLNLKDLSKHNVMEHDGSLSRADSVTGDANSFNEQIWKTVKARFTGQTIDTKTMALARRERLVAAMAANPKFNLTSIQVRASAEESAFILGVLAGNFQNPQAPTQYMTIMFEEERIPFNEGFKTSPNKIFAEQIVSLATDLLRNTPPMC